MILDSIRVRQIAEEVAAIRADIEGAERLEFDTAAAKSLLKRIEGRFQVDLDEEVDLETALADTGLSERSLHRRPHEGSGKGRRWKVRDLLDRDLSDPGVGPEDSPEPSPEDLTDLAVTEALAQIGQTLLGSSCNGEGR